MSGPPWFKFFPSDWRADANLRMCSPSARCLWMEMLCLMHEAQPRGHLTVNGLPVNQRALAIQAGMTVDEVASGLAELEAHKVFDRRPDGTICSRKMIRETRQSEEQRARAQSRWNKEKIEENVNGNAQNMPLWDSESLRDESLEDSEDEDSEIPVLRVRDSFAIFWKAHPNKVHRRKAVAAYAAALKRIKGADPAAIILAGLERAKLNPRWVAPYIPHPTTWLNGDGWLDEPAEVMPIPTQSRPAFIDRMAAEQDEVRRAVLEMQNGKS